MSSSRRLHPTAESVYEFIVAFKEKHVGESPTRREIAGGLDRPVSVVNYHLWALDKAGWIVLPHGKESRMITIPGAVWRLEGEADTADDGFREKSGVKVG